ncbi:MAG: hypothetical protein WC373_04725 [Smithella sp.]|jgi:hypothetical protein
MKKTSDKTETKVEKIAPKLQAAITGLLELYDHCADLLGKSKQAALDRVRAYVQGNRDKWQEVATGLKDHTGYAKLKAEDKQRASNNLRYLRQVVGVKARPTVKRGKASKPVTEIDLQALADKHDKVILPDTGRTPNERAALINQVLTALDNALGCTRADTIELILTVTRSNGAKKQAA